MALAAPAFAQHNAGALRDAVMEGDTIAWDFTEGLTTEVGPRQAGTEAEERGRVWAKAYLDNLGFSNVRIEPFTMPTWVRGTETAEVVSPFPQPMHITALGGSSSTGDTGMTGEIVFFPSYAHLAAAEEGSLNGKIAFVSHNMKVTQDGSGYGFAGPARWTGANLAAKKGAKAIVIRSVGTDYHRNPHTGGTRFEEGVSPIPAGALSLPDAENLARMVERAAARRETVKMKLVLTPQNLGMQPSGNVIAEVPGSDPDAPMVLAACHLDSWDLGTGAFDDGAGCGIIAAAAKHIMDAGQPRRTIRILFAGAEEVGVFGGKAYGEEHADDRHAVALESDFGADRVWRVDFNFPESAKPVTDSIATALAPLGIARGVGTASGGADIGAIIAAQNLSIVDLQQDGTRYFDLHHTPDDTLDKIDPQQLRQNVAAWTATLSILANSEQNLLAGNE